MLYMGLLGNYFYFVLFPFNNIFWKGTYQFLCILLGHTNISQNILKDLSEMFNI